MIPTKQEMKLFLRVGNRDGPGVSGGAHESWESLISGRKQMKELPSVIGNEHRRLRLVALFHRAPCSGAGKEEK